MNFFSKRIVKISTVALLICFCNIKLDAQVKTKDNTVNFWDNVRIGGGLGLSFGDGFFSGTVSPIAIYEINPQFSAGLGLNATINNRKNFYKSTILGGSLITLFNPTRSIQLSAEYEQLHVNRNWDDSFTPDDKYWYPALFLGAGYRNGNVTFGIRYDVLYDDTKSIYADAWLPFVRFYF
jgi:hypothetical protein